ncbi:hypothetical protein Tco_0961946, partial [Tanacetum coccineum]
GALIEELEKLKGLVDTPQCAAFLNDIQRRDVKKATSLLIVVKETQLRTCEKAKSQEEVYFSNTSNTANVSNIIFKPISIPDDEFSDDTPSVARKFLNEDEIAPIVNQVDARVQNFENHSVKEVTKFVRDFKSLVTVKNQDVPFFHIRFKGNNSSGWISGIVSRNGDLFVVGFFIDDTSYTTCPLSVFVSIKYRRRFSNLT